MPFVAARPTAIVAAAKPTTTDANARMITEPVTETLSKTIQLSAYPNPSSNTFNLQLVGGSNDRVSITVISFDGKVMYQSTGNSNSKYSFGNNFMPGMYIVKVMQGNDIQH